MFGLGRTETREEVEDIAVSDAKLDEKFGPAVEDPPATYGGIQLTESEAKAMALPCGRLTQRAARG